MAALGKEDQLTTMRRTLVLIVLAVDLGSVTRPSLQGAFEGSPSVEMRGIIDHIARIWIVLAMIEDEFTIAEGTYLPLMGTSQLLVERRGSPDRIFFIRNDNWLLSLCTIRIYKRIIE